MSKSPNNLYKYSRNLNLSSYIEMKNDENNINSKDNPSLIQKKEFLKDLSNILEDKLKINIRLHQKGFEIYKQKVLSDKTLILNTLSDNLKTMPISQLLSLLKQIKEENDNEKLNSYFNMGKNMNIINSNNKIHYKDDIEMMNENQNSMEMINKMFNDYSNLKNIDIINNNNLSPTFNYFENNESIKKNLIKYNSQNNNVNNKLGFKNKGFNDPRLIYHSPSPLILKKQESKIIEENKNTNNQLDFDEPQNC